MGDAAIVPFPAPQSQTDKLDGQTADIKVDARSRLKRRSQISVWAIGGMLLIATPMVTLIPISGAVVAAGEVGPESRAKSIVHPDGGVLAQLLVRDGDKVQKGQMLLSFATDVLSTTAQYSGESLSSLQVRRLRLEAEAKGLERFALPPDTVDSTDPAVVAALAREQSVMALKRSEMQTQLALVEDQKRQIKAEVRGFQAQLGAISRQRNLLAPELRGLRNLYRQELVTINRLNEAERNDVSLSSEAATLEARISQATARTQELSNRAESIRGTAKATAGAELNEIVLALADSRVREANASEVFERSVVRAPQPGIVDGLAFSTVGSAVPAGQELMRIIPQEGAMVVQVKIAPSDVDQIKVGQSARVKFSGFNQQTTPEVTGKLVFVSADITEDSRTGMSYYRAHVSIDAEHFTRASGLKLSAGMPAEAYITTTPRSMFSYVTKPLMDQLSRAFRDEQ